MKTVVVLGMPVVVAGMSVGDECDDAQGAPGWGGGNGRVLKQRLKRGRAKRQ